jgi:uncharacterized protein with gpF-like domain
MATSEHRRQVRIMAAIERAYQPRIAAELARSYAIMAETFADAGYVPDVPDHEQRMRDILEDMANVAVRTIGGRVLVRAGEKQAPIRLERKDFASTMAKIAMRYIMLEAFRRHIVDIAETTRAQIIAAVQRGYSEGLGQSGVASIVRDLVPSLSRHRSAVIARTETHGAASYGGFAAAQETGLDLRKEWVAAEDERTREDHAAMNGTTIAMGEAFEFPGYTLMYPGDPSGPPEGIINCRCTLAYVPE